MVKILELIRANNKVTRQELAQMLELTIDEVEEYQKVTEEWSFKTCRAQKWWTLVSRDTQTAPPWDI